MLNVLGLSVLSSISIVLELDPTRSQSVARIDPLGYLLLRFENLLAVAAVVFEVDAETFSCLLLANCCCCGTQFRKGWILLLIPQKPAAPWRVGLARPAFADVLFTLLTALFRSLLMSARMDPAEGPQVILYPSDSTGLGLARK